MCTLHHHSVRVDNVKKFSASAARDTGSCWGPCPIAPSMCTLHHHDVHVDNVTNLSASAARDTGSCRGPCPIAPSMCTPHHHDVRVDNVTKLSASAARDAGPIKVHARSRSTCERRIIAVAHGRSYWCITLYIWSKMPCSIVAGLAAIRVSGHVTARVRDDLGFPP
uniref:Uncharacterized protein n=1 Tax=Branchiostoma floridae TaxID=7739 RepID=C3YNJ5_BRAFL|eukprot:XP_002602289.1 hypothetical protein BRAFLDRAFT_76981 [Branchiostoma floridae]